MEPALYIVATPIGHLADISLRGIEVLRGCALIAAEDTRRTGQLLHAQDIATRMLAYHEHSAPAVAQKILDTVHGGRAVALVSDAGTPTISDPGYRLVRAAQEGGIRVVPVPGACAAIAALSASGLPSDRFAFEGFLPNRREARRKRLSDLVNASATLIFYEAPHRLRETLADMAELAGEAREAVLARELTKSFETIRRDTLSALLRWVDEDANQSRGEIVLLLAPAPRAPARELDAALSDLLLAMAEQMPARAAAKLLSAYSGIRTKTLYAHILELRDSGDA